MLKSTKFLRIMLRVMFRHSGFLRNVINFIISIKNKYNFKSFLNESILWWRFYKKPLHLLYYLFFTNGGKLWSLHDAVYYLFYCFLKISSRKWCNLEQLNQKFKKKFYSKKKFKLIKNFRIFKYFKD